MNDYEDIRLLTVDCMSGNFTPNPILSIAELENAEVPMTRDGVPYRPGMVVFDGCLNALIVVEAEAVDWDVESVKGTYRFVVLTCRVDQHGRVVRGFDRSRPENLFASNRNALEFGTWKTTGENRDWVD